MLLPLSLQLNSTPIDISCQQLNYAGGKEKPLILHVTLDSLDSLDNA